jgi:hypothetical protein
MMRIGSRLSGVRACALSILEALVHPMTARVHGLRNQMGMRGRKRRRIPKGFMNDYLIPFESLYGLNDAEDF